MQRARNSVRGYVVHDLLKCPRCITRNRWNRFLYDSALFVRTRFEEQLTTCWSVSRRDREQELPVEVGHVDASMS
jgi:hypothetical protein